MKKKINKKKLVAVGHLNGKTLAGMRETAYGQEMRVHIYRALDEAGKRRDDEGILKRAEEKRARKAAKALANAK